MTQLSDIEIKYNLVIAYQILSKQKMDDLTYTYLSARAEDSESFFIYPFGLLFSEVHTSNLMKVKFDGTILEGEERQYNKTGYVIHGTIYEHKKNIKSIFHLHTIDGVAVSCMKFGLLLISQFALHFYKKISYHNYDSLALDYRKQGLNLIKDLGNNKVMILRNHGTLTCGSTIEEAMFYTHHLEQACKIQVKALNAGYSNLIIPESNVCEQAAQDLLSFKDK